MSEIKISDASELVDPRTGFAEALAALLSAPTPEWAIGRIRLAKCPYCRRRPEFVADGTLSIAAGVADEPEIIFERYVIQSCCSAHYAKREDGSLRMNEGLSRSQARRIQAQVERNQHVPTRGPSPAKASPVESRNVKMPAMRKTAQSGGTSAPAAKSGSSS